MFVHSLINALLIHLFVHSFISCVCSLIHSFVGSFIHLFIPLPILSKRLFTGQERYDGRVSVGSLVKVGHHLCRALPGVAAYSGLVSDVSAAVYHCSDVTFTLLCSHHSLFKLHFWHWRKRTNKSKRSNITVYLHIKDKN